MKTDEDKGKYVSGASEVEDSTNNAMAMMGAGYDDEVGAFQIEGEIFAKITQTGMLQIFHSRRLPRGGRYILLELGTVGAQKLLDLLVTGVITKDAERGENE